jgi:putative ABC transport system permease protein
MPGQATYTALRTSPNSKTALLTFIARPGLLLLATAGGIIGITVYWVDERRRQIGLRRALGAKRSEILAHILTENFFIILLGVGVGSLLALTANVALMHFLEMTKLPTIYIALGSAVLLALGQCAALSPARRAARMSPMEATRAAI